MPQTLRNFQLDAIFYRMEKKKLKYRALQLMNIYDVLHLINTLKEENHDSGYEFTTT